MGISIDSGLSGGVSRVAISKSISDQIAALPAAIAPSISAGMR